MSRPRPSQLERNRRILVVDDNPEIHGDFRKILAPSGGRAPAMAALEAELFGGRRAVPARPVYLLESAMQGEDAVIRVAEARDRGARFAVAFVDVRMPPGRSGVDTVRALWEEDPDLEIVLCTAYSDLGWDEIIGELGHGDRLLILKKPFDAMEVQQLAHALTEKWTLGRESELTLRELAAGIEAEAAARRDAEAELLHAQKLEAVGRLAAGLAHELNTPLQIAFHCAGFVNDAYHAAARALEVWEKARDTLALPTALLVELSRVERELDLAYLREQAPEAARDLRDGLERVAALVRAMKRFSNIDNPERAEVDLSAALADTLAVSRAEITPVASVETELAPLPAVRVHAGDLNLVFLGLIRNALQAIADKRRPPGAPLGKLRVASRVAGGHIVIEISDTGVGIPPALRDKIFEPFFTTRSVGRGTGLGLATARAVVQKHGGSIDFTSVPGEGTTFTVRLPIDAAARAVS
jgi:two-component system NtrC family sensor kinase